MGKDITHYAKARHTVKAYDSSKKISAGDIEKIKELLRYAPSSVNGQPWHFILTASDEAKAKITQATDDIYPPNSSLIRDCSYVLVCCHKTDMEEAYLSKILAQEDKDGRFDADPAFKDRMNDGRHKFVGLHQDVLKDVPHWTGKQLYLNVGALLLGVSTLGIDATPMEGIDTAVLDEEFGLPEKGYNAAVLVTLGYRDEAQDFNATLPKSRLPYEDILTEL